MGQKPADGRSELWEMSQAWEIAETAFKAAQAAGNPLDVAEANRVLGRLCVAPGNGEEAGGLLEDALARFEQLDRTERAADVPEKLNLLRNLPPSAEA